MKIAEGALQDPLTGLFNRRHLEERLASELAAAQRHGRELSLLLVDVDFFKTVNDRHGHLAGDEALKMVAFVLRGAIRKEDVLARYGGEEFVVVARETGARGRARARRANPARRRAEPLRLARSRPRADRVDRRHRLDRPRRVRARPERPRAPRVRRPRALPREAGRTKPRRRHCRRRGSFDFARPLTRPRGACPERSGRRPRSRRAQDERPVGVSRYCACASAVRAARRNGLNSPATWSSRTAASCAESDSVTTVISAFLSSAVASACSTAVAAPAR